MVLLMSKISNAPCTRHPYMHKIPNKWNVRIIQSKGSGRARLEHSCSQTFSTEPQKQIKYCTKLRKQKTTWRNFLLKPTIGTVNHRIEEKMGPWGFSYPWEIFAPNITKIIPWKMVTNVAINESKSR